MAKDETFFVLLVITLIDVAASDLFLSRSKSIINEGDSMAVVCKDEGGQLVTWRGPKGLLRANTQPSVQDTSIGKLLKFNTSKKEHTGNYTCSLSNNKDVKKIFSLTVVEDVLFKDTPEEQRAVENKQVLLRCEVSGDAKISWKVEDEEDLDPKYQILADGLLITKVRRADSNKIFNCQASQTSTGKFLSKKIKLIVEHKPEPVYEEYKKVVEIYGFIGEYVNLTCSVMAEPAPKFSWEKKTGRIFRVGTHVSILQIHMTERAAGNYQCTASNPHGELVTIFNVLVGKKPEPPTNVTLMNYTKDSLTLGVELPIVPQEDVADEMEPKWLVVQYRINGTEEWNFKEFNISQDYTPDEPENAVTADDASTTEESIYELTETLCLTDLRKSTTYEVIAATKNVASLSDYTNSTYFTTSESANARKNSVLSVILLNLLILFVSTPA